MIGETINFTISGCLLHLPMLTPQAAVIDLCIELPDETRISTQANVVWREPPRPSNTSESSRNSGHNAESRTVIASG